MNKRRLGRGLEALLGREEGGFEGGSLDACELIQIAVDQIDANPFQPRRQFNSQEIASLADSLRQHGMLQPVLVRAVGVALSAHRRGTAAACQHRSSAPRDSRAGTRPRRSAGLRAGDGREPSARGLECDRQGDSVSRLPARYGGTQEELAGRLGLDRSTISNLIRLLELPEVVLDAVRGNEISQGHARALLGLPDEETRTAAYRRIVAEHLSVRQTEALVATGVPTPSRPRVRKDAAHAPDAKAPIFSIWNNYSTTTCERRF